MARSIRLDLHTYVLYKVGSPFFYMLLFFNGFGISSNVFLLNQVKTIENAIVELPDYY